jgi:hypothetical protein
VRLFGKSMCPYVKTSYVGLCGKEKNRTFVAKIKFVTHQEP